MKRITRGRFPSIVETFITSATGLLSQIAVARDAADAPAVRECAHSLKSAAQLGAIELHRLALAMEEEAKAGELKETDRLLAEAQAEFSRVQEELARIVAAA